MYKVYETRLGGAKVEPMTNSGARKGIRMTAPRSAEDAVTDALRTAIRQGVLAPGERLAQAELADQLGVSRIPLRDALRRLEMEGVVHIGGRRGAWVTRLGPADISEIYEMRLILETRCTQYAVEALADGDMERVIGLSVEMDREDLSPLDGFTARRSFYADLYRWAGRPRMRRTVLQLRDNVDRYHILSDLAHSHEAHEELRTRIRAGDGVGAAAVAKAHLEEARDDLLAAMEQNGSTEADDE